MWKQKDHGRRQMLSNRGGDDNKIQYVEEVTQLNLMVADFKEQKTQTANNRLRQIF